MEKQYTVLKKQLKEAHEKFQTRPVFKVGKLNDVLLAEIIERIRANPSLENFILFTNCLNFFYSTRLQSAVNKDNDVVKSKNDIIINVAKKLKENSSKGLRLIAEKNGGEINPEKVEKLRVDLKEYLNRGTYSFSTKVFHQLNSNYPILDANVNKFMQVNKFKKGKNFYSDKVDYATFYSAYQNMMEKIGWDKSKVNELDNAIWVLVDSNRDIYFKKRNQ